MTLDPEVVSKALSNLALLDDHAPNHTSGTDKGEVFKSLVADKLKDEAMFMLATYCFDLSKRFAMLHFAVSTVCEAGDPDPLLALLIAEDDAKLNAPELTWRQRSEIAGSQLKIWHDRAHKTNEPYLRASAEEGRVILDAMRQDFSL